MPQPSATAFPARREPFAVHRPFAPAARGPQAASEPVPSDLPGDRPIRAQRLARDTSKRLCRLAREITGAVFAVPVAAIEQPTRATIETSDARHIAMYIAHVVFQVSLATMAGEFGRDRSSVAYAVRRIEDGRDDPAFDATIDRIERLAHAVLQAMQASASAVSASDAGISSAEGGGQ